MKSPSRESGKAKRERSLRLAERLAEVYPDADCALEHQSAWQLLVATILSAQCTDEMVNRVTPGLFDEYPDPVSLAGAPRARVEKIVRRTGFYRQKAKSIQECAESVVEKFGGEVPRGMDDLVRLRGVGRKTASVVRGTAFGEPAVFVDTHVGRLSRRLGLTRKTDPDDVQKVLMDLLPEAEWTLFCHRLIHHGRQICKARKPLCDACPLADLCPQIGVK